MAAIVIAGLDEAGRGAIAGPVVAAACCEMHAVTVGGGFKLRVARPGAPCRNPAGRAGPRRASCALDDVPLITDSKLLTAAQREDAFVFLMHHCPYGVGVVDAATIDAVGILEATERAMHEALRELQKTVQPAYLLIDGRDRFWFDLPHSSIIRGDVSEPSIAAASILAKVTRDRLMSGFDGEFPGYGFAHHKGYGTRGHLDALRKKGICPLHRRTFLHTILLPRRLMAHCPPAGRAF